MKKIISLVLTVCILFTMVYAVSITASAATATTTIEDVNVDLSKLYRIGTTYNTSLEALDEGGVAITTSNYGVQIFNSENKIPTNALWLAGAIYALKDKDDKYVILQPGYEYVINIMYDVTAVGTSDPYYQPQIGIARNNHSGNAGQDNGTVVYTAKKHSATGSYSMTCRTTPGGTQPLRLAFAGHGTFNIKSLTIKKVSKTANVVNADLTNIEPIYVSSASYSNFTPATADTPFSVDVNATYAYNGTLFDGTNTWINTWTTMYLKTLIPLKFDANTYVIENRAKDYTIDIKYKVTATSATDIKDYPEIGIVFNNAINTTTDNGSKVLAAQRINPSDVGVEKTLSKTIDGSHHNHPLRIALTGKGSFEIISVTIKETTKAYAVTFVDGDVATFDCVVAGEALPTPAKEGYTFEGWFASADFTGDAVETASANDTTVYAKWTSNGTHTHSYESDKTDATCTVDGKIVYTCSDCGDTYEEVITAKGHTEVVDEAVAPTISKTGLTEGKHCSVCGTVIVAQEIVPKLTTGTTGDCTWTLSGTTLTISGGTYIDADAFFGATNIETVVLADGIKVISEGAFAGCTALTEITIPEGVTSIGDLAFANCSVLAKVGLPSTIEYIGECAFKNCGALATVDYNGTEADKTEIVIGLENEDLENAVWNFVTVHEHVAGDWEVVTEATVDADGLKVKKCACGEVMEEKVIPRVLNFRNKTLSLQSNISIIFRVDPIYFTKHGYSNPVVTFNFLGVDYPVTEYTVNASGLYEYAFNVVAPHQMKEMVYATVSAEYEGVVYTSAAQEYSIYTYCNNQITKNSANAAYKKVMALLVDILNYGAAAQTYQGYNTNNLANAELTAAQKALGNQDVITYTDEKQLKNEIPANGIADIKVVGLTLQDSVVMNFKFELLNGAAKDGLVAVITAAGRTWEIEASEFVYESSSKRWIINFNGLNPAQMRENVSICLKKDGVIVSDTATYSVESYGLSSAAQGNAKLAALVEAMARYGRSAKAYNG